jgi:hypothetical protein
MDFWKRFWLLFSVALTSMLIVGHAFGATYYVKNSGDDGGSGLSDKNAWRTISKVNSFKFADGDTVRFRSGDVFNDATLKSPGVNNFTIEEYGDGEKPLLDGDRIQPISIKDNIRNLTIRNIDISGQDWTSGEHASNILIEAVNGVTISGVIGNGHRGGNRSSGRTAIRIRYCYGDVELSNLYLYNWGPTDLPQMTKDIQGVAIRQGNLNSIKIHHSTIFNVNADAIQVANFKGVKCEIFANKFYNFGENAIDVKAADNFDIYNNEFFREPGYGLGGSGSQGESIVTHGEGKEIMERPASNITIRDNYFHDTQYTGIRSSSSAGYGTNNLSVIRNVFENCKRGVWIGLNTVNAQISDNIFMSDIDFDDCSASTCNSIFLDRHSKSNITISNNTVYNNQQNTKYAIYMVAGSQTVIKHNIVWHNSNAKSAFPFYWKGEGKAPLVEENCWFNPNNSNRVKLASQTFSAAQLDSWVQSGHPGELFENPLFNDPKAGDFSLKSTSPCRNEEQSFGSSVDYQKMPFFGKTSNLSSPKNVRLSGS